jgi:tetratricopeptide (TPR) repeat protein
MAEGENPSDRLEIKVQVLSGEVDALQKAVLAQKKRWYTDASTLIALLALVFSFGTTYVSDRRTSAQDIENQRAELRALLQRIVLLPRENLENAQKYANDANTQRFLSASLNQENSFLLRQAVEIAKKLPRDRISAAELYTIAVALENSYDLDSSMQFLDLALQSATTFNDEIGALRDKASLLFMTGKPEAGRVEYQKALDIFSKYPTFNTFTKNSTHIWTEISWASSERSLGFMELFASI